MKKGEITLKESGLLHVLGDISIASEDAETWKNDPETFKRRIEHLLRLSVKNKAFKSTAIAMWESFYERHFKKKFDFSDVVIPEKPPEGNWSLLIIADISLAQIVKRCGYLNMFWEENCYPDPEKMKKQTLWDKRDPKNGPYAIWVKDIQEAEAISDDIDLTETETLLERLIHGIRFRETNGILLDMKSCTVCAGSLYPEGTVPKVDSMGKHGLDIRPLPLHAAGINYFYRVVISA